MMHSELHGRAGSEHTENTYDEIVSSNTKQLSTSVSKLTHQYSLNQRFWHDEKVKKIYVRMTEMLNLIVVGNPDKHSFFSEDHGEGAFPVSRLFESTPDSLRSKLLPLTSKTLEFLQELPVIFMTEPEFEVEVEEHEDHDLGGWKSHVSIGRISNIKLSDKKREKVLVFDYELTKKIGYQYLASDNNYKELELGSFGLSRNFWAVKSMNLNHCLDILGLGAFAADVPAAVTAEAPDNEEDLEVISDINQFLEIILNHPQNDNEDVFYRGHSDISYQLEPSLFRKDAQGNYRYRHHESDMITELLTVQPAEFRDDRYMLDKLVRMQHYGLPTRLLDVSTNPLIALYFACSKIKRDELGNEIDGNVIILTTPKSEIKFFDSDTVSCIANLSRLPSRIKSILNTSLSTPEFNATEECGQLLHLIRNEKSYFKSIIDPAHLNKIVLVKGRLSNVRISSQAGAFLLFGENVDLPETGLSTLNVRKLLIRNKEHLMRQLSRFGINESTVYPGIEKAATEIAKLYDGRS
ncbi:FRG domain-containing protein [Pantoea sp. AS142]|uniref:FRG domain-containing protein n=1 Tax=Pantoea sp. AS142 TaxID=3081292 RepID=UPI00301A106B